MVVHITPVSPSVLFTAPSPFFLSSLRSFRDGGESAWCVVGSVSAAIATALAGGALPRAENCASEMGCAVVQSATKRDVSGQRFSRTVRGVTNAALKDLEDPVTQRGEFPSREVSRHPF